MENGRGAPSTTVPASVPATSQWHVLGTRGGRDGARPPVSRAARGC